MFYGTHKKELRKLYAAMPEMKYAVNRYILDLAAETVLGFTTGARIVQNVGGDSWYLWLSGAATTFTVGAERYYARKASQITGGLPGALYSGMIESPHNTLNTIVERRDIASWQRLQEALESVALPKKSEHAVLRDQVLSLEKLLEQENGREKVRLKIAQWDLIPLNSIEGAVDELIPINYASVKQGLHQYASALGAKGLLKENISLHDIIDKEVKDFPSRNPIELRRHLSETLKSIIREPNSKEYACMLRDVRTALDKNIKGDMGIFMSNYPLAYLAGAHCSIPLSGFIGYYLANGAFNAINSSGFARLNNVINLNYVLKELDKDSTISSGADVMNQLNSHLARVSSGLYPLFMLTAAAGQYFSPRTSGMTNYVMDAAALAMKYAGAKQWYQFMDALITRCEKDEAAQNPWA